MNSKNLRWFGCWLSLASVALVSCSDSSEEPTGEITDSVPEPEEMEKVTPGPEETSEEEAARNSEATETMALEAASRGAVNTPELVSKPENEPVEDKAPSPEKKTPGEDPTFPEIVGVESPIETDILWTAYYIAPVTRTDPEEGQTLTFSFLDGKKVRYSVTGKSFRRAEMEAVAVGLDKEGRKRFGYRISEGVWRELPEGSMGMGNKVNPLVPLVHIAADQGTYPYGSLVQVPEAVGRDFGDGKRMTGYFWIADTGGRIEGDHFDLFVGREEVYSDFLDTVKRQRHRTTIHPLPRVEKDWDPRNNAGLTRILISTGHLEAPADGEEVKDEALREAVVQFQKDQPFIPSAEYGDPDAATSLWFLVQAALEASNPGKSDAGARD